MAVLATLYGPPTSGITAGSGVVISNGVLSIPGWASAQAVAAMSALSLSASRLTQSFTECDHGLVELAQNNSGGTVAFPSNAVRGAVALLSSTATISRYAGVLGSGGGLIINIKTDKWYFAARAKFSASDAQSSHELGIATGVGGIGTVSAVNAGVGLIINNGVASLQCNNGGSLTTVASSWTFDTTTSHDIVVINDTATITLQIDGTTVATTSTLTNVPTSSAGQYMGFVSNGTTAANRTITLEKIGVWTDLGA